MNGRGTLQRTSHTDAVARVGEVGREVDGRARWVAGSADGAK